MAGAVVSVVTLRVVVVVTGGGASLQAAITQMHNDRAEKAAKRAEFLGVTILVPFNGVNSVISNLARCPLVPTATIRSCFPIFVPQCS